LLINFDRYNSKIKFESEPDNDNEILPDPTYVDKEGLGSSGALEIIIVINVFGFQTGWMILNISYLFHLW